jgi:acyl carrier protein
MRQVSRAEFAAEENQGMARRSGIEPAEGMRLFRAILSGGGPPQVAVRPWADGRYLPLPDTAGRVPASVSGEARASAAANGTGRSVRQDSRGAITANGAHGPSAPADTPGPDSAPVPDGTPASLSGRLRDLWAEVLGVAVIRPEDDFFDLGGDSLVAVELISRIRESFGVATSIVAVFENPTLAAMATVLAEQGGR